MKASIQAMTRNTDRVKVNQRVKLNHQKMKKRVITMRPNLKKTIPLKNQIKLPNLSQNKT